jgi:Predicted protein-tyrosine phosphatase
MWICTLNWDEIRDNLIIGSCPMKVEDLTHIRAKAGASALLSLQHDQCLKQLAIDYASHLRFAEGNGLVMRRVPMRDFDRKDMQRYLPRATALLHTLLAGGHRVYVHCTAGLGRAPLTALSYLSLVEGWPLEEAWALIEKCRSDVIPNLEALQGSRADLVKRHRARIELKAEAHALRRQRLGGSGTEQQDWDRAEREIIREVLSGREENL